MQYKYFWCFCTELIDVNLLQPNKRNENLLAVLYLRYPLYFRCTLHSCPWPFLLSHRQLLKGLYWGIISSNFRYPPYGQLLSSHHCQVRFGLNKTAAFSMIHYTHGGSCPWYRPDLLFLGSVDFMHPLPCEQR